LRSVNDGAIAVRFEQHYLRYRLCDAAAEEEMPARPSTSTSANKPAQKSTWMKQFELGKSPSLGKAIVISNATS
jgi:hypothetical protein